MAEASSGTKQIWTLVLFSFSWGGGGDLLKPTIGIHNSISHTTSFLLIHGYSKYSDGLLLSTLSRGLSHYRLRAQKKECALAKWKSTTGSSAFFTYGGCAFTSKHWSGILSKQKCNSSKENLCYGSKIRTSRLHTQSTPTNCSVFWIPVLSVS